MSSPSFTPLCHGYIKYIIKITYCRKKLRIVHYIFLKKKKKKRNQNIIICLLPHGDLYLHDRAQLTPPVFQSIFCALFDVVIFPARSIVYRVM